MGDAAKVDAAAARAEYQRKQRDRKRLYRARLKVACVPASSIYLFVHPLLTSQSHKTVDERPQWSCCLLIF